MNRLARKGSRRARRPTKLVFELLEPRIVLATPAISGAETIDEGGVYTLHLEARDPGTTSAWTIDWGDGSDPDNDSEITCRDVGDNGGSAVERLHQLMTITMASRTSFPRRFVRTSHIAPGRRLGAKHIASAPCSAA